MRLHRIIASLAALVAVQPAWADGLLAIIHPVEQVSSSGNRVVAIKGQSFEASDYTAVRYFSDDWRGDFTPRNGRNLAVSFAHAEVSAKRESWSVGYFYRHDVLLESNRDMTEVVHANKTRSSVITGKTYDLRLAMNGFSAQGVRLDKTLVLQTGNERDMTLGIGISLLGGQRMRMGQAYGSALATPSGYIYSLGMTDADSKKTYPFMPSGEVSGLGYALDWGLRLQWKDGKRLDLAVNDLFGEIRWKNLPQTTLQANSATASRDAQGYIVFNPSMTGQNTRTDATQRLTTKGSIQFRTPLFRRASFNLGTEWIKNYLFPRIGLAYITRAEIELMADYDARFGTYSAGMTWRNAYLAARTQNLNLGQSRGYGWSAGMAIGW